MVLVIAHGLPKSGSTFLYSVAKDALAAQTGMTPSETRRRFFGEANVPSFVDDPTDAFVDKVLHQLPPEASFVIKTHGALTPHIATLIQSGAIKAFASFRDPRDTIIAMLDAGEADRRSGSDRRFFASMRSVDEAIDPAKRQWARAQNWLNSPGVLRIPFYLIAREQDFVIAMLCDHLGVPLSTPAVQASYAHRSREAIPQFHKGIADRFLTDLPPGDVRRLTEIFAGEIREADDLSERTMQELGFRSLWASMTKQRDVEVDRICSLRPSLN